MKFLLNGCDISFVAEAPDDITLKQLLTQCDRIIPDYCACGIRNLSDEEQGRETDIVILHNDIKKVNPDASCSIDTW